MDPQNLGSQNKDSITLSKDLVYGLVIAVFAGLLVLSVFTQGFGLMGPKTNGTVCAPCPSCTTTNGTITKPTAPQALQQITVTPGRTAPLGQTTAPVTIVEFSDFQCPYCARLYTQGFASVKSNYVSTGKVKVYFRDYPLPFHPNALPAAMASRCANDQGKFWEMHNMLFENQAAWSALGSSKPTFEGYAVSLGMNNATFSNCLETNAHSADITLDQAEAQNFGVEGTPASFIVIPKSKVDGTVLKSAVDSINAQLQGNLVIFENANEYTVLIPGAYPYQAFDAVLKVVRY